MIDCGAVNAHHVGFVHFFFSCRLLQSHNNGWSRKTSFINKLTFPCVFESHGYISLPWLVNKTILGGGGGVMLLTFIQT